MTRDFPDKTTLTGEEPVYLIFGTDPEELISPGTGRKLIEVCKRQNEADIYMMRGLLSAFASHCENVHPGGTLSVMVNIGSEATTEDPDPICSNSSFVVNDGEHRHVWEFDVERRRTARMKEIG